MLVYLDASALMRLAGGTDEAAALRRYIGSGTTVVTCRIAEADLGGHGKVLMTALAVREVDSTLMREAASLRSTDVDLVSAIHLAAALELRRELDGFVTYEGRLAAAARALRLPVVAP